MRRWLQIAGALCALNMLSCDATGVEAPQVYADSQSECPSSEEALSGTRQAIREGRLQALTDAARTILFDDGGARVLLPALFTLSSDINVEDAFVLTQGIDEGEGLARLTPHLVNILGYFDGQGAFSNTPNYAPVDVVHNIMTECDSAQLIVALNRITSLQVTRDGQTTDWPDAMFDILSELSQDPVITTLLDTFEVSDEGVTSEGRNAFKVLTRLFLADASSPNFELGTIRTLFDDFILTRIPREEIETRERLETLFDFIELAVDPNAEIAPAVAGLVRCVNDVDEDAEFGGMIYDYLQIEELQFSVFVSDLNDFGEDPAGRALARLITSGLASLEERPRLVQDSSAILARFIGPEYSRESITAIKDLRGEGVASELLRFVNLLFFGCSP